MNHLAARHAEDPFVILAVTDESASAVRRSSLDHQYPIAFDPTGEANANYSVTALPTLVLIDQQGVVREMYVGGGQIKTISRDVEALLGAAQ